MASALRAWVERLLPWYQPAIEAHRNARTEAIARRSKVARLRAEQVITEYRRADERVHR